jgi:glycosyltransferase involved in cell wall biosynthesis
MEKTNSKKIKVLVVPSDRTGVSYYRSTKPHVHLEQMYPEEFHVDIDYEPQLNNNEWLKQYDIIHYHRTLGDYGHMEDLVKHLNSLGIVTIMDLDDYWLPEMSHPAYHIIKNNDLDVKIRNNIKTAENVTTTTSIFADEIKKVNKSVKVLPNAIDPNEKQFIPNPEPSDKIRIGWLGGSSHLNDLQLLNKLVTKLKSDGLLDKIQFVICGFDIRGKVNMINKETGETTQRDVKPEETVWVQYEKIFTDNYSTISPEYKDHLNRFVTQEFEGVENEPYRRVWTKPISSYATNYNLFDISLAPLVDNTFNKVKSQLKVIESGFHKKALIAQNFGPYTLDVDNAYVRGGEIDTSKNGFLVDSHKNHKSWYQYLKRLIQEPEMIKTFGDNLYNTVKDKYSLDVVTKERADYYKKLLKEK